MRLEADWTPLEKVVSRDLFRSEIAAWAKRIGVEAAEVHIRPMTVHIRPMTRKWGSCSTTGRLSFNTELLTAPAKVRRRVIVEELST